MQLYQAAVIDIAIEEVKSAAQPFVRLSIMPPPDYHTIIIGAGAAGMMCGAVAAADIGAGHKSVLILDHAKKAGEKIRISGGGRCNFTNIHSGPSNFISGNPHFCKSALAGYTPHDFLDLVERYKIAWHEKTKGQLFCDEIAQLIIDMLRAECEKAEAKIQLETEIKAVHKTENGFSLETNKGHVSAKNLVIACGGPSIPKMGATGFAYTIAKQFGVSVTETRAGLVPLTFTDSLKEPLKTLSGVSTDVITKHKKTLFDEALLFTHRGLSGPAILQISSYWRPGDTISIDLAPTRDCLAALKDARSNSPKKSPANFLGSFLPSRLADFLTSSVTEKRLADMNDKALIKLADGINNWTVKPAGSEGMRTAEVTLGGIDTNQLSSKTMEVKAVPGLFFVGEAIDVTGHLGGHNFQWAWASGVACGRALANSGTR